MRLTVLMLCSAMLGMAWAKDTHMTVKVTCNDEVLPGVNVELRERDLLRDDVMGGYYTDKDGVAAWSTTDNDGWLNPDLEPYIRLYGEYSKNKSCGTVPIGCQEFNPRNDYTRHEQGRDQRYVEFEVKLPFAEHKTNNGNCGDAKPKNKDPHTYGPYGGVEDPDHHDKLLKAKLVKDPVVEHMLHKRHNNVHFRAMKAAAVKKAPTL